MKKQAFTLVEIMVVLVILGVLSAIALPKFSQAMEIRKAAMAMQQMKIIRRAVEVVRTNNRGYDFCDNATKCNTTDKINAALELDMHNSYFNFIVTTSAASSVYWSWVTANRQNGSHDYELRINYLNPDTFTCSGSISAGCDFIKMAHEEL